MQTPLPKPQQPAKADQGQKSPPAGNSPQAMKPGTPVRPSGPVKPSSNPPKPGLPANPAASKPPSAPAPAKSASSAGGKLPSIPTVSGAPGGPKNPASSGPSAPKPPSMPGASAPSPSNSGPAPASLAPKPGAPSVGPASSAQTPSVPSGDLNKPPTTAPQNPSVSKPPSPSGTPTVQTPQPQGGMQTSPASQPGVQPRGMTPQAPGSPAPSTAGPQNPGAVGARPGQPGGPGPRPQPGGAPPGARPPGPAGPPSPSGPPQPGASATASKPQPQPAKAPKSGGTMKWIAIGGGVLAVLVAVGVGLFMLLGGGGGNNAGPSVTTVSTAPGSNTSTGSTSSNSSSNGQTSNTDTTTSGDSNQVTSPVQTGSGQTKTITYWGLWESASVLQSVFADFEAANPGVSVEYVKQSYQDYRTRLQTAIGSRNGPDIFRYHASWVPMLSSQLDTMPSSVMSARDYQQTFYPVVSRQLQVNGQVVGVPLMYDSLGLYYNKQIFAEAGVQPPETWAEVKALASQLTVRNGSQIQRAGLAIGNTTNVEHFADILGLLIYQNGGSPANPNSAEVQEAITFYTNFFVIDQVWSSTLPQSSVAFARGEVAMFFAPSWRAHEIIATNPNLDFGVVPVPRLGDQRVTWATYWAEGVNKNSSNKALAWQLLKYLSTPEVMQKLYASQAQERRFGEIYSRTDLASELAGDSLVSPFLSDANQAQNWYLNSYTHDEGINDQIIDYYSDYVDAVISGGTGTREEQALVQGVQQVLGQYNVSGN